MKNTIHNLKPVNFKDWSPADFEVMATILFLDSYKNINKAKKYVNEGIKKAIRTKNKNGEALLLAQLIKLDVEMCNENLVPKEIEKLLSISLKIKDPKILTRTYRAMGVGSKFLAMESCPRA